MSRYLLIESRDPFETREVERDYEIAAGLARAGHDVTFFLVQNGVLAARRGTRATGLADVVASGATVRADEFSLRERGIAPGALAEGVAAAPLELVVDGLVEGRKAIWL